MRILLIAHGFPRSPDDMAGSFLLTLARGQQALGHAVGAVVPHAPGLPLEDRIDGVRVWRYRYGTDDQETLAYAGTMHEQALRSWPARWRLLQFIRASRGAVARITANWRPHVLHVHWWVPGGLAVWPPPMLGPAFPPVVLTSHGTDLFLLDRFPLARLAARPIFHAASQVTVISTPLVRRVQELGVPDQKVSVIPMPVDAARFTPEEHGGGGGGGGEDSVMQLLFVGRLIERKGAAYAIEALAHLANQGRQARLTVVGDGPLGGQLEKLASARGVTELVDFRGRLPAARVAEAFAGADVFLMPAVTDWKGEQEGFGLVVIEAMLSGLPVVASRSGGIPDIIQDGETGLLAPERDAAALARAICRLQDDPALGARLAQAAARRVEAVFSPEAIARGFDGVYQRATGAGARP